MTELAYKTKSGGNPERKPRVYFTCHPADMERSLDKLCEDIFASSDCAVFYTADMTARLPEETGATDLERMNLFVIPVSLKLLLEPNRAMDEDFPFARDKHIPVLPIMLEPGLDMVYSREDKFGSLQYLDPNINDSTAIPYAEKLKKYLRATLFDSETVDQIQKAFDAYIFLSYRKKDRKLANELMRLIHADPMCRDIAIWFDEFLTPGESFTDTIREAMERSKAFALLVTPSLLELNDRGEDNYVKSTEYPAAKEMAKADGKDILPAELLGESTKPTDRKALFHDFADLPEPLDISSDLERESFLARLRKLAVEERINNPTHNYLIGLAYLDGIDVEADRERGLALITDAGEDELPEAMEKLYCYYSMGIDIELVYEKASYWAEKLASYYCRVNGEEHPDSIMALYNSALMCFKSGDNLRGMELTKRVISLDEKVLGEEHPSTLIHGNNLIWHLMRFGHIRDRKQVIAFCQESYDRTSKVLGDVHPASLVALVNLANAYSGGKKDERQKALELHEKAYALYSQAYGETHRDTLSELRSLALAYSLAVSSDKAIKYLEICYASTSRIMGEEHPDTLKVVQCLANQYHFGNDSPKAIVYLEKTYQMQQRLLGEEHPDTIETMELLEREYGAIGQYDRELELQEKEYKLLYSISARTKLGNLDEKAMVLLYSMLTTCDEKKDYKKQIEVRKKLHTALQEKYGEVHRMTLGELRSIAVTYGKLGDYEKELEMLNKTYDVMCESLGESHAETLYTMEAMAAAYKDLGKRQQELEVLERVYSLERDSFGEEHVYTVNTLLRLAETIGYLGDYQKALMLYERAYAASEHLGLWHPQTLSSLTGMAETHNTMGERTQALALCDKIADQKVYPPKAVVERVARIYERNGQSEKAEALRNRLKE